ncbi:MAG: hypothetical protein AB4080_22130 [Trichodesmium sp.]
MQLVYIILLTTSLSTILIYNYTSEDISFVLAVLTGLICLLWGFACSPWLVQLLIVLGLFYFYRFYLLDSGGIS